jgi:hypothetical protein
MQNSSAKEKRWKMETKVWHRRKSITNLISRCWRYSECWLWTWNHRYVYSIEESTLAYNYWGSPWRLRAYEAAGKFVILFCNSSLHCDTDSKGWDKKPGVKILFGRWQDVVGDLELYDGIFFDTYGEFYYQLKSFHDLLGPHLR